MEKHIELENLLSYSSEDLAEGYFDADVYAEELKYKLQRYQKLVRKETSEITEEERAERAGLRIQLKKISDEIVGEI